MSSNTWHGRKIVSKIFSHSVCFCFQLGFQWGFSGYLSPIKLRCCDVAGYTSCHASSFLTALYGRTNILHQLPDCISAWRDVLDLKCQRAVRKRKKTLPPSVQCWYSYKKWWGHSHINTTCDLLHILLLLLLQKRINYWTCESSCFFSQHRTHWWSQIFIVWKTLCTAASISYV